MNHNKKTLIGVIFVIVLLSLSVSADQFKDYLGNPTLPEQGKLNPTSSSTISLFDGAATYSYPIEVPPGVNSLSPQLSLTYNSHSSSGQPNILGTAWALSQSYIERDINSTLSPLSDDEFKLIFNGQSHDLIYVPSENRFHTKIETFLYIQNITGAPNTKGIYWLVKTKDGTVLGQCQADGSGGIECLTTSDIRRKKDIANDTDIESDKLNTIRIVKYKAADGGSDKVATGVIAQELAEIYPELVTNIGSEDVENEPLMVNYEGFVPRLIKAFQEQNQKIKVLEARIAELEKR